ncbi:MAG: efflux RND transporter periplasmic adaptor subunit [Myxococcota bacterium]|nr:efflux RND transporter periplasmic adaptor subunit [Myxococcota bacterium]
MLVYPLLILLVVVGIVFLIAWMAPEASKESVAAPLPAVRIQTVEPEPFQFRVDAQGTVVPRREGSLRPQISGEVVWVSPALVSGGFFEQGEALLRIDPTDYAARVESEEASLARAESEARRAQKELKRQRSLADRSVASQARIDDAENAARVSDAVLREARSRLGQAQRDLDRTELRAPYTGRIRSERVDPGQFVSRGESLADLYAVDFAEVRLPIPDRELGFMDLPLGYREDPVSEALAAGEEVDELQLTGHAGPRVRLRADFAGEEQEWWGELVRTEGEIDPKTRMVTVVVRVEDPYGRLKDQGRPPLAVGLFVDAMIEGIELPEAIVLPRSSLQQGERVYLLDNEDRVHFQPIEIARSERDQVIVRSGIEVGDRVSVTPMPWAVEGMQVLPMAQGAGSAEVVP